MSNNPARKKTPKTMGEGRTLPALSPDARNDKSNTSLQHRKNVVRAKKWVDEHKS